MPLIYLTKEDRLDSRLASYVYGELKTRNMSQSVLAERMGISKQALSQKLRKKRFSFDDFIHIIEFFEPDEKELNRLVGMGE